MTLGDIAIWTENWLEQTGQRPRLTLGGPTHSEEHQVG